MWVSRKLLRHFKLLIWLPIIGVTALFLFAHQQKAVAAGPSIINFQGKVVNSDGTNVANGSYSFDFVLYDDPSLGSPSDGIHDKWHELSKTVTVTNGVFQTNLGSATALPNFNTNNSLYLAVRFNSDAAGYMSPRIQLSSVPYALNADNLNGLSSSSFAQLSTSNAFTNTNSITTTSSSAFQVANSSGQIFTVDTSGSQVVLGKPGASGITGKLTFDNSTNSNTVSIQSGTTSPSSYTFTLPAALPGSTQCVTSDNTGALGFTACNLQTGYTVSTGGTTPEIKLDSTRKALDIQDADTTIGATEGLLNVRGANGSGLGASLFVVQGNGRVGINNGSTATAPAVSYDLSFGQGADRTIGVETQATTATAGNKLTVSSGTGNTSGAGGILALQGGTGGSSGAGGAITIQGGTGNSAAGGAVSIDGGTGSSVGAINIGTNANTTLTVGTNAGTFNVVPGTVNFQETGTGTGLGPNVNFMEAESGSVTITSNLSQANRTAAALIVTQPNDPTNHNTTNLVQFINNDTDSEQSTPAGDILQITSACASGCGSGINLSLQGGSGITFAGSTTSMTAINTNGLTGGTALSATGYITGQAINFSMVAGITSASIIQTNTVGNFSANYTGKLIDIEPVRTLVSGNKTDSGTWFLLSRSYIANNTTGASQLTISGPLASLQSNCTVSDGGAGGADSCIDSGDILDLNQQDSIATGTVFKVQGAGSGKLIDAQNGSGTSFTSLDSIETSTANNFVSADPSMEAATLCDGSTNSEWQKRSGSETTCTSDTTNVFSGKKSLKVTTRAVADDGVKYKMNLVNGTTYTVSWWLRFLV